MLTLTLTPNDLTVTLTGWSGFWALKRRLTVPRAKILSVHRWIDEPVRPAWLRCPGTCLPGIITAGTYRWLGRREFWSVRHRERAIVINLEPCPYTRLVLEVENGEAWLAQLQTPVDVGGGAAGSVTCPPAQKA